MNISRNLGYVDVPEETPIRPNELDQYRPHEVLIPLHRQPGRADVGADPIAYNDHPAVFVERGDTVILCAAGSRERARVHDTINQLAKSGAEVLHQENAPVHVSGHGHAEELRTMLGLVRPKAVMPVHGEFRCSPPMDASRRRAACRRHRSS